MNETMINNTTDPRTACDQYLRRGIHTPEVLNESPKGVGNLLPQHLESKLVNALNTINVLRPLCTEVTTTGDSALPLSTVTANLPGYRRAIPSPW